MLLLLGFVLSGCATGNGLPEFTDMDFLALVKGEPSIIQIDQQGHATTRPIDFLKGQTVLAWDVATLNDVVTCEKSQNKDEFVLKYYQNHVLAKTFTMSNTTQILWMVLVPEKNYLLIERIPPFPEVLRIDLKTGNQKALDFGRDVTELYPAGFPTVIKERPWLDPVAGNLIALASGAEGDFLVRLNPDNSTLTDKVPLEKVGGRVAAGSIGEMLAYDRVSNSMICNGVIGEWPLYTYHGSSGFLSVSLDTGKAKMITKDTTPDFSGKADGPAAIINQQYVILTRVEAPSTEGEGPRTFLLDLKNGTWADLFPIVPHADIPYVTWPISQEGLHVETTTAGQPAK